MLSRAERKNAVNDLVRDAGGVRKMSRSEARLLVNTIDRLGPERGELVLMGDGPTREETTRFVIAVSRKPDGRYDIFRGNGRMDRPENFGPEHVIFEDLTVAEAAVRITGLLGADRQYGGIPEDIGNSRSQRTRPGR